MKQVTKTADITARLKASFGGEVDVEDMAVFEVTALNDRPIRKKHPLFEGAVAGDTLLRDLVSRINTESVPLQLMHNTGDLPSGRVFDARLNGQEVRALLAVSKADEPKLVHNMDQGIIDQVSVNLLPKQILCSDCGWDFMGADAGVENVYLATCGNGHTLRTDGVHANLVGLSHLAEISLVNTGGAQGAKIQPRNNQIYADPAFQRLAASGHSPALLLADLTPTLATEEPDMDLTELIASLTTEKAAGLTLVAANTALTVDLATAAASVVELTASNAALTTELADLKAATPPEAPAAVLSFLTDLCTRSLIATGDQTPTVPTDATELVAKISETQTKLSAMFPLGGVALSAVDDKLTEQPGGYAPSAFRTAG